MSSIEGEILRQVQTSSGVALLCLELAPTFPILAENAHTLFERLSAADLNRLSPTGLADCFLMLENRGAIDRLLAQLPFEYQIEVANAFSGSDWPKVPSIPRLLQKVQEVSAENWTQAQSEFMTKALSGMTIAVLFPR